ncbi:uncharacterized protein BX664DRAFT_301833 [Halteromyces radiatus]|uniref:uncharacterized protein n=1 Tax=Halteromyces radiatus TaxID=101107 RepID=UPI00221EF5D8|nr:uncharacterized protein BX664DRAFT_301833 [Halteromyces radiatus]KAI8083163.1 hypothetical protein BX664DRAFT_301833 [Halteromyces radiatus]
MGDLYPTLSWYNVIIASCFLLVNVCISYRLGLKLGKPLIIAAIRCIVQLTIMGMILQDVFKARRCVLVMLLTFVMIFLSACETVYNKSQWMYKGIFPSAFFSTLFSTMIIGILGCRYAIQQQPFWAPEYFIPTIGLLLGFTSGAMAVALHSCLHHIRVNMGQIETYLAFGGTRWEAVQRIAKDSIRLAMLPTINQMSITGSIVIPGAMAGQVILGVSIQHAVMYQQIITFLISSATCIGVVVVVMFCLHTIVDSEHRIRQERIQKGTRNVIQNVKDSIIHFSKNLIYSKKSKWQSSSKEDECQPLLA